MAIPSSLSQGTPVQAWHSLTAEAVLAQLHSHARTGLSHQEAARRLKQHGPNLLQATRKVHWYTVLARQFVDVLIFILLAAAVLSLAIGEVVDAIAILVLNGVLGFVQEWKAERAIEALKRMLEPHCKVIRDGTEQVTDARCLVPGDLVTLDVGDRVPADLRLVEAVNLKVDESVLTGESVSVSKDGRPVESSKPLAERASTADHNVTRVRTHVTLPGWE